jgi:beta-glucanase (GH16 family)
MMLERVVATSLLLSACSARLPSSPSHGGGDLGGGVADLAGAGGGDLAGGSGGDLAGAGGGDLAGGLTGWQLTWSDEFDAPDGSSVDPAKWNFDLGGGLAGDKGWGNNELEYYTSDTANAVIEGGALVITGTTTGAAKYQCWYGTCQYTSARLTTSNKFSQQYGRFEARIKIPRGQGVWPAFWMLGQNFPGVDWPACGEIDIMENIGSEPATAHGTTHGPGPASYVDVGLTGAYSLAGGAALADGFHVFATEWEAGAIRFYVDGALYKTVKPADLPSGATWVWDHPYFLLLNFAVGGDWPGSPDATTKWPQTMVVDYVRAYRKLP